MPGEDLLGSGRIGPVDADLHVQAPGTQDGGIDHVLAVGGPDDDDVAQGLHAVDLRQDLGHDHGLDVGGHAGATGAEEGLHLIEEDDYRPVLGGGLAGLVEDGANLALGLADELAQKLRTLDVEERGRASRDARGAGRISQRGGHGLGDEGLAAAGRAVEQQSLGCAQTVGVEQLGVGEGQLEGIADLLDLRSQATDVRPGDIGCLGHDQLLDASALDESRGDVGAQVGGQGVTGLDPLTGPGDVAKSRGQGEDPGASCAGGHQDPGVIEPLLEGDGLTGAGLGEGSDDEHLVVDGHAPPDLQLGVIDAGVDVQEHLAARQAHGDLTGLGSFGGIDGIDGIDGIASVTCGTPRAGKAGEQSQRDRGVSDSVELLSELGDAFAGGAQSGHQALVLGRQADGPGAGLTQLVAGEVRGGHPQWLGRTGVGGRPLRHGWRRPGRRPRSR